ncbi:cobalt ECF transporter T component CbiQ [Konateibacter massiliensis]|uniref:cobalt ECF transporter T component CbiQ n=1 Tax=Konateibacter massiliensis TaxID=2002841 RepID=UPI000C147405|nr:cobalt ECF transporter T component CbiQ [Konateibacter massiliensis]
MHNHHHHHNKKHHSHGNRTLDMDNYAVRSGLAYVNPDLKLWAGVISLILCLFSRGFTSIVIAVAMIGVILYFGKVNAEEYWHLLLIPFTFILLSGIVLLVDLSKVEMGIVSIPILHRYLVITWESLFTAVRISVKAMCSVTCLYMISLSTPMYEIIKVLRKCKLPEIMIELMFLIYRFIFVLLEAYSNMKTAADTRLGYINWRRSYQSFFGICTNLFVIAFQKASKNFDAMEARGYDGNLRFLESEKPVTKKQLGICGVYFVVIISLLTAERIFI